MCVFMTSDWSVAMLTGLASGDCESEIVSTLIPLLELLEHCLIPQTLSEPLWL